MKKRYWVSALIFVLYIALVIVAGFLLHFEGTKLVLFCLVLILLGALALAVVLWYLKKIAPPTDSLEAASSIDSGNLDALIRDANKRLKQAARGDARSLAQMPLIYIVGDENAAKTQTVLQSGLDPELIAGQIYRDQSLVPTQLVNIWYTGSAALVEAGGKLLRDPGLWRRLVRLTQPGKLGTALSRKALQPTRAAVLCVSIERIMAPNTSEQIRALAQAMNERLRQLSQTLGISLPVYVLFTKIDTVPPFADYVANLTDDEVKAPLGSLLEKLDGGAGLYAERATSLIGARLDEVTFSLAQFRMAVLSRGGQADALARAYELPRDLRKLRSGIVDFLVEAARPSQLGVNPYLRGFFFSGMRAHIVEDVLQVEAQRQPQQAAPIDAGATQVFSLAALQQQAAAPAPLRSGGTRKIAQWVFLPHLLSRLVLGDKTALESSRASTRVSVVKRVLWASLCALIFTYLVLLTISFFNNKSLEDRVAAAAAQPITRSTGASFASLNDLQNMDQLRIALIQLDGYRKDGPPLMYRWGVYKGDALYAATCQVYGQRLRSLLLSRTVANIMVKIATVQSPPPPEADYNATYKPLKAYLIVTANPDKSTSDFLPAELQADWQGALTPQPEVAQLAQSQFELYATLLAQPQSCVAGIAGPPDQTTVAHAREYLSHFGGFQHVYQSMLSAASRNFPTIRFNDVFPGSARFVVDAYEVPGAFSKGGFAFMQDAIQHPDPYFSGEEWVLGPQSAGTVDRSTLPAQLQQQYSADFLTMWRTFVNRASFVPYQNMADAGAKLSVLDSNASPLLELFSLVSLNTAVSSPDLASAFQAPQAVVPPTNGDNKFAAPSNQPYIQALQGLEQAIKTVSLNPISANDPTAAMPILQAAGAADQAAETLRGTFNPDNTGHMDAASFNLLEAPIKAANALAARAPAAAAGGGAKSFCAQMAPLMAKFPLNPLATVDATPDEVAQIFQPQQGALAQFYNTTLKQLIVQQGAQYVPAPGSTVAISPAFLTFFNAAEKLSTTLYPAGGTQAMLSFTLTEVKTPGVPDAALSIDGQQLSAAGQTAHFIWMSQPSSRITLTSMQNTAPTMSGPWSVFHLAYSATHPAPNQLQYSFQFNGHTNQVVRFDASGPGADLLDPRFMSRLHCVSSVAH
jgi:type VI secretion system protein ImpL